MSTSGAEGEKRRLLTEWGVVTKMVRRGIKRLGHDIPITGFRVDLKEATKMKKGKR